jgi:glycosyltransferase involved in cell wall biosynthesis
MRVVHVTDTFLPKVGGAEIAIDQLVRAMTELGVECAVLAQTVRRHRKEIDVPYTLQRYRNPQSSRWAGWWVERHIRRLERQLGPFDVMIGHHAFPPGYACVKHSRRSGRPAIIYPRGGDIYEVSRFRKKAGAWRKLSWALANASAVVCASEAMEHLVRQIVGLSSAEGRTARIPNGVNVEDLRSDCSTSRFASEPRLACPFVLGLGRTIRRKGFHLLIDAFGRVKDEHPEWKLVIAGEGRDLEPLRAQAGSLGDRVIFTGLVQDADKRYLLQHCRFMAAPSLEESFGNVALEAMACGKPVVASRASGFAEIVRHGENGKLVEVGNAPALAHALGDYMRKDLRQEGEAAAKTASEHSWKTIARRYIELIEQVKRDWQA